MNKPTNINVKVDRDFKVKVLQRCEDLGGLTLTRYIINLINKDIATK